MARRAHTGHSDHENHRQRRHITLKHDKNGKWRREDDAAVPAATAKRRERRQERNRTEEHAKNARPLASRTLCTLFARRVAMVASTGENDYHRDRTGRERGSGGTWRRAEVDAGMGTVPRVTKGKAK